MRTWILPTIVVFAAILAVAAFAADKDVEPAGKLTPAVVRTSKGDGPDGVGNTRDDTWQFWFQIMHDKNLYLKLSKATEALSEEIRKNGIKRKVWGPIGSTLPNPEHSEGWIYHSDWDGKREGVWGDVKAGQVLVVPYQEKADGGAICITYRIPADGKYAVTGKATDLEVDKTHRMATGARVFVDITSTKDGKTHRTGKRIVKPVAFGDKLGPVSVEFKSDPVTLKTGQLVRLVIDPVKVAYRDVTAVEFEVTPVK